MGKYYCFECSRKLFFIKPVEPPPAPANEYQLEKFIKHTQPTGTYDVNSVFDDPSWTNYQNYLVAGSSSGCLEIDDRGRKNLLFFAGERTGLVDRNGAFISECSGVKVVFCEDESKMHGFASDFKPESRRCERCGRRVPFDHWT